MNTEIFITFLPIALFLGLCWAIFLTALKPAEAILSGPRSTLWQVIRVWICIIGAFAASFYFPCGSYLFFLFLVCFWVHNDAKPITETHRRKKEMIIGIVLVLMLILHKYTSLNRFLDKPPIEHFFALFVGTYLAWNFLADLRLCRSTAA